MPKPCQDDPPVPPIWPTRPGVVRLQICSAPSALPSPFEDCSDPPPKDCGRGQDRFWIQNKAAPDRIGAADCQGFLLTPPEGNLRLRPSCPCAAANTP